MRNTRERCTNASPRYTLLRIAREIHENAVRTLRIATPFFASHAKYTCTRRFVVLEMFIPVRSNGW